MRTIGNLDAETKNRLNNETDTKKINEQLGDNRYKNVCKSRSIQ